METSTQPSNTPTPGFQIPAYVLDDLCSRFIINIPDEERQDLIRIFFQIELAHWFYLDFYCAENQELRTCGIKDFSAQVFKHCPFLSGHAGEVDKILENWRSYKMSVPTYGAIMLDPDKKYCLLVQGFWTKCSWGFPKGKVNEEETAHDCAVRENYFVYFCRVDVVSDVRRLFHELAAIPTYVYKVLEETGFDISNLIDENVFLENHFNDQLTRLYIVPGVPLTSKFQPRTRKEIKSLQWFPIDALPAHKHDQISKQLLNLNSNTFFMVIPFIKPLRKWIAGKFNPIVYDIDNRGLNFTHYKQNKPRENTEGRQHREKQKQKLQQYFAQQNQNEFKEFLQLKESRVGGKDERSRSTSPRKEPYQKVQSRQLENKSPKLGKKQYHIMNRDGTLSGSSRRSLNPQFDTSSGRPQNPAYEQKVWTPSSGRKNLNATYEKSRTSETGKTSYDGKTRPGSGPPREQHQYKKITHPDGLGSETWLNFRFDVPAIMECLR